MVPPYSHRIPRVRWYSGSRSSLLKFRLRDFHSLRLTFPGHSAISWSNFVSGPHPESISTLGLASSAFARHYSQNLWFDFSSSPYLDVSVRGVPFIKLCIHLMIHGSSPWVFPHSDTRGSLLICSSPRLFAACRVLLRLPVPRHSPYALVRLNFLVIFYITVVLSSLNCLSFINILGY